MKPRIFLTAEWRHLVLLNYEVDPAVLQPYVPQGLELDFWNNKTYVSVVGFAFQRTALLWAAGSVSPEFSRSQSAVLREARTAGGRTHGVVFLKEIVPRRQVAFVARRLYGEKFVALPMWMTAEADRHSRGMARRVRYDWRLGREHYAIEAAANGPPRYPEPGSLDEFIIEHYWAYSGGAGCTEYEVEHPPWLMQLSPSRSELYWRPYRVVWAKVR